MFRITLFIAYRHLFAGLEPNVTAQTPIAFNTVALSGSHGTSSGFRPLRSFHAAIAATGFAGRFQFGWPIKH